MARLRFTPQKREFFDLYSQASANTVEIARLLVELLERFPEDGAALVGRIKGLEHEGDRLTHEVVLLLNSTFVTPFDRDDMYRLAGALDDICDHIDEASDNLGSYGVDRVPEKAREQADVILRAATKLDEAVGRLQGSRTRAISWPSSGHSRTRATSSSGTRSPSCSARPTTPRRSSAGRTSTSAWKRPWTRSRMPRTSLRRSWSRTGSPELWRRSCWSWWWPSRSASNSPTASTTPPTPSPPPSRHARCRPGWRWRSRPSPTSPAHS